MPAWYIEPRDPLIVRDGRPFGPDPGARAHSINFPTPATTSGGFRSRAGLKDGVFDRTPTNIQRVLRIGVRGPLLVALNDNGSFREWLPPAPADALLIGEGDRMQLLPMQPLAKSVDTHTSIAPDLDLIGPCRATFAKPTLSPPRFWHWEKFTQWLLDPYHCSVTNLGVAGPGNEWRTHVAIEPKTQTASDGFLFQTSGLEFTTSDRQRLALVIESAEQLRGFRGGFVPLGGERRLMAWRPGAPALPACPEEVRQRILEERACRVILLTPAHFDLGYCPTWLPQNHQGVTPKLKAVLVQRAQLISGWDMQQQPGRPKPTRRLAPSGSVFFLCLSGSNNQINSWIDHIWMQNVSDDDQSRRDGFGLAALGCWDGRPVDMEVQ
jgi:CRISPR-associated protein Cmr3